jgi:hypothetical protein
MKKVVYFANSLAHKRVLESFKEVDYLDQTMVVPRPQITSGLVPENYKDFGVKKVITFNDHADANRIIKKINPDILAQTGVKKIISVPDKTKKVYIGHGMVGNHVTSLSKRGKSRAWKGFDLYCGQTKVFEEWVEHATGEKQNVLLNACPQLDLLADKKYILEYKNKVIKHSRNKNPNKVILFCGFCCKQREDFMLHNEDYFSTALELDRISKKHNYLTLIKPKQSFRDMFRFLQDNAAWGIKYMSDYDALAAENSQHSHFINTTSHIYRYFFADMFVCNGCSTVELEACVVNKPLVLVRTKSGKNYDPFNTVSVGAGVQVSNIKDLESAVVDGLSGNNHVAPQKELLKKFGIVADGKAHERIQRAMVNL